MKPLPDDRRQENQADRFRIAFGIMTVLICAVQFTIYRNALLTDPDTWWHIRSGADIWRSGSFPARDTYSHTFAGTPWIAKEWLSQIILYFGYEAAGWNGVASIGVVSIGFTAAAIYFALSSHWKPIAAVMITLPALFLVSPVFLARPHLLTIGLLVIWTYILFERARQSRPPAFGLLALLVLWANLHAGFTLAFVIAFFAFLDFLERTRFADKPALARWIAFLALCPLVTLIHPYGYKAMLATLTVAGPNEAMAFIKEWRSFSADNHPFHEAAILGLVFAMLVSGVRLGIAKSLFLVLLLHMFLSHVRFAYVLFPAMPIVVAADIAKQFPALSATFWRSQERDRIESLIARHFKGIAAVMLLIAFVLSYALLKILEVKPEERVAIASAISYAKSHKLTGKVMNWYGFGGPLIFDGVPTYIDGRTDQLFLGGFSENDNKMRLTGDRKLLLEALERYNIGWTLLPPDDLRVAALDELPDWKRAYADEFAVIHVRAGNEAP